MPDSPNPDSLESLRERWRQDRSSRLFLQLAEELRRAGELDEAIAVLGEGLSFHSHSVAGLVALGRCQLEAGANEAATGSLERALDIDPAQLVANKLITEAWLRLGDAGQARRRLEIYRLLNERDLEIESYEQRLAGLEGGAGDGVPEPSPAPGGGTPIFPLAAVAPAAEPIRERRLDSPASPSPFAGLPRRDEMELRARAIGADESVFRLWSPAPATAAFAVETAPGPDAVEAGLAPPPVEAEAPATTVESEGPPATETTHETTPPVVASEPASEAPQEPAAVEPIPAAETAPESAPEPAPGEGHPAAPSEPLYSLTSIGREVESEPLESEVAARDTEGAAERREGSGAKTIPAASSTLAALYLQQGHLDEAEREFRAVLDLRPGDPAAVDGLERVAAARDALGAVESGLPAAPTRAAASKPGRAGGLTQRRIAALAGLLSRLRAGRKGGGRVS